MGRIYLVRHGRTQWNRDKVFRGMAEVPLDEMGREQARAIAGGISDGLTAILTSPVGRAMETAAIAAGEMGGPEPRVVDGLRDIDFGVLQGVSKEEACRRFPGVMEEWRSRPQDVRFPQGERLEEVAGRAWASLVALAREHRDGRVMAVSHRVVIKVLLLKAMGAGLESFWRIRQDTACINVLDFGDEEFWVRRVNDTCHLKGLGPGRVDS
ncbi:MAG: histidine phosphatase family protein [Bacillota bacterium]